MELGQVGAFVFYGCNVSPGKYRVLSQDREDGL
jgi:hypothetical protein